MASVCSQVDFEDYFEVDVATTTPPMTAPPMMTATMTAPPRMTLMTTTQQTTTTTIAPETTTTPKRTTTTATTATTIAPKTTTTPKQTNATATTTALETTTTTATTPNQTATTTTPETTTKKDDQFNYRQAFERMERKIDFIIDIVILKQKEIATSSTSTTAVSTTTTAKPEVEERFFDDVFTEFDESIKEINMEKKVKKEQTEKKNLETLLIISLSSAGCGCTVLLMVTLSICLKKKPKVGNNQEAGEGAEHIYDELRSADPPLAQSEENDLPFIDEADTEADTEEEAMALKFIKDTRPPRSR